MQLITKSLTRLQYNIENFIFLPTGDREKFALPEDVTILHAEFTYYYYPGDLTFPCK